MPRELSAGAILFRQEDSEIYYLLLHYKAGHWDFSKGHIEKGEDEIKTIKREAREETGISDIKIIDGFKERLRYFFKQTYGLTEKEKKNVPWTFKMVTFYLAETKTKEVVISDEHLGYKWLPYQEALGRLTYKNSKKILKKAHSFIKSKISSRAKIYFRTEQENQNAR